ncbi:alpha/beta fold hydrolase [Rhodococcus sp. NPDC057529]|uniref:alpha/beta fold hydrolase n=1 Tax=Rhodococcus sp. NPDC057529 TaxID=3346158 RepID=UPI00366CCC60
MSTNAPSPIRWSGGDSNDLAGEVWGDGQPAVVLLHGAGQTHHAWGNTGLRFAEKGLTTAALDLRGHGASSWDPLARYAFPDHARDLSELRARCADPLLLVGASLGGVVSLKSALGDPRGIRAVVLVDITPTMQMNGVARVVSFMRGNPDGFADLDEAREAIRTYQPHRRRQANDEGLRRNLRHNPETGRWIWHWDPRTLNYANPGWYVKQARDMSAAVRALDALSIPVLVVRGEHSDVILPRDVEQFRALGSLTADITVAGARHMVAGDANEVFLRGIFEALSEIEPRVAS